MKGFRLKFLFCVFLLVSFALHAKAKVKDEAFSYKSGKEKLILGKLEGNRYYSAENIFSCEQPDLGGELAIQDLKRGNLLVVAFYSEKKHTKIEMSQNEPLLSKEEEKNQMKKFVHGFGIGVLKKVDEVKGLKIHQEEFLDDEGFFLLLSFDQMKFLNTEHGFPLSATKGYLSYRDKDKLILLSHQIVSPFGDVLEPEKHFQTIKKVLLDFKKTIKMG